MNFSIERDNEDGEILAPSRLKEFSSSKDYKNEQVIERIIKQTLETVNL